MSSFMNDQQLLRYNRHILVNEIDFEGQQALLDAHVLVVGAGGLGCPVILYLAASGVGRLTIIDDDVVELSNLQRQVLFQETDVGFPKVEAAKNRVAALNSEIQVEAVQKRADADWLAEFVADHSLGKPVTAMMDCTDNSSIRYQMNQMAIAHQIPWVSAAAVRMQGQYSVFDPRETTSPCYQCLYPQKPAEEQECSTNGVLSPLLGVVGSTQAVALIKVLLGKHQKELGKLNTYDAMDGEWRRWGLDKVADCPACS